MEALNALLGLVCSIFIIIHYFNVIAAIVAIGT